MLKQQNYTLKKDEHEKMQNRTPLNYSEQDLGFFFVVDVFILYGFILNFAETFLQ